MYIAEFMEIRGDFHSQSVRKRSLLRNCFETYRNVMKRLRVYSNDAHL